LIDVGRSLISTGAGFLPSTILPSLVLGLGKDKTLILSSREPQDWVGCWVILGHSYMGYLVIPQKIVEIQNAERT